MRYIKLLTDGNVIVAVEALEEPDFVREENGHMIRCSEHYAQGVLSEDGGTAYQLQDRQKLSGEQRLTAIFIADDEYEHLHTELGDYVGGQGDETDPTTEAPAESTMSVAEMKAMLLELKQRLEFQEETSDFLGGCIMEMGEVVYG